MVLFRLDLLGKQLEAQFGYRLFDNLKQAAIPYNNETRQS